MSENNFSEKKEEPANIFRKSSLDRFSFSDELEQLVEMVDIKWWIALSAVGVLIIAAIAWGIFGSIESKVSGEGMIMRKEGIFEIDSLGDGIVENLGIKTGAKVKKGQIFGYVSQKVLTDEMENNKKILQDLYGQFAEIKNIYDKEKRLLDDGIVSELEFAEIKSKMLTKQMEIDSEKAKIESMHDQLEQNSKIVSQYEGRIIEVSVDNGSLVKNGTQVALVELEDKRLQAVLYFFLLEGKKILPGMPAQVTPTTIKEEEYGFMYGKVIYASEFPATPQELTRQFHNEDLVRKILSRGSPIEVHVELIADDKTPTGYKWSSKTGPPGQIYSGTLCRAKVIVRRQRPVSLLIPAVKRNILGIGEQH